MKILAISHEFPPIGGGGANAAYYLTKGFVEKGHKVTLITANYQDMEQQETINGVTLIRVNAKRKYKEHCSFQEMLSFILKAYPVAEKFEENEHYDICLIFFGIPSGPLGYMLKKRRELPYVVRFGGGDIPGFQNRFKVIYKILAPFVRGIWKNADGLVANSEGLCQLANEFYSKRKIDVITNGVDDEYFCPKKEEKKYIDILFVSRLIERKGVQYIIPKLDYINERTKENIRFTIVGDGPYKDVLLNLANKNNNKDIIEFVGQKNKTDILKYYQKADIFVLPSKKEGMPNVVLEAMACGLPIIMSNCEGSKELVVENGFVAEIEKIPDLLIRLCNNEEERVNMGINSRKRIQKLFSWDIIVEEYIKKMEDILDMQKIRG